MGLLDIYNNGGTQLNQLYDDFSTQYPPTNTGTPTTTQNPGGPVVPFHQQYNNENTYIEVAYNQLSLSPRITNLDVENDGVQGGIPYKPLNDPTTYPIDVNHSSPIRGWFASPSSAPEKFNQEFTPKKTYMEFIQSYI